MPIPVKYKAPFIPGSSYHLLFRSNDGILMCENQADYDLFLTQYMTYFRPVLDTFAYGILQNHAHFVAQVKDQKSLIEQLSIIPERYKTNMMRQVLRDDANDCLIDKMIERQVNSFMSSYALKMNWRASRRGGLFQSPFRRSFITSEEHLIQAIIYVHANAEKHGLIRNFKQYQYSSWNGIITGHSKIVNTNKVLEFFGSIDRLIELHDTQVEHFYRSELPGLDV